ncbi:MAG: transposase [Sphingobacteriaceae bacterium]
MIWNNSQNEHHLGSWSGVSPSNNEGGGKKSTRTIDGNNNLQATLTQSAWGVEIDSQ